MVAPSSDSCEETSRALLLRARTGDEQARDQLLRRYLPLLKRWARGRLPRGARDRMDTDDLVQETLLRALRQIDQFTPEGPGAFGGYLRQTILNRIRDEARRAARQPAVASDASADQLRHPGPSPLEEVIGEEALARYESALARLEAPEREAILARLELDCSYAELAIFLDKPSADAARMTVRRALVRLACEMNRDPARR